MKLSTGKGTDTPVPPPETCFPQKKVFSNLLIFCIFLNKYLGDCGLGGLDGFCQEVHDLT